MTPEEIKQQQQWSELKHNSAMQDVIEHINGKVLAGDQERRTALPERNYHMSCGESKACTDILSWIENQFKGR